MTSAFKKFLVRVRQYNNLTQRIIAALAGVAILLTAIIYSPWTYFAIFLFICLLCLLEFYRLTRVDAVKPIRSWGSICGMSIFFLSYLVESGLINSKYYVLAFPLLIGVFFIQLYRKDSKPFHNIAFTLLGVLYISVPFALLNRMAFRGDGYDYMVVVGLLFISWASDTGAYFVGARFGKTKLFERVSPKKTWEGSLGGTALAMVTAFVFSLLTDALPQWQFFAVAVIIVVAGTYGDLFESLFKRSLAVKDSGDAIPGHGGFLDRFDGIFVSLPFVAVFLELVP